MYKHFKSFLLFVAHTNFSEMYNLAGFTQKKTRVRNISPKAPQKVISNLKCISLLLERCTIADSLLFM